MNYRYVLHPYVSDTSIVRVTAKCKRLTLKNLSHSLGIAYITQKHSHSTFPCIEVYNLQCRIESIES
jgi:hypothetical protein